MNVMDFGAVGDGATDDTDAIAAALASGPYIEVPARHFRISSPLVLRTGQVIRGLGRANYAASGPQSAFGGPWLDWTGPPAGPMIRLFGVQSILVENIGLFGGMNSPAGDVSCLAVDSDNDPSTWQISLLRCVFAGARDGILWGTDGQQENDISRISECDFRNCFSTGISIRGVNSLSCSRISDCRFMDCGEACIRVHSSGGAVNISGCAGGTSASSAFLEFAGFTGSVNVEGSQSEGGGHFLRYAGAEDNPQITLIRNVINDRVSLDGIVRVVSFGNEVTARVELLRPGARWLGFGDRFVDMPDAPLVLDPHGGFANVRQPFASVVGECEYAGELVVAANRVRPVLRTGPTMPGRSPGRPGEGTP